jgi:hypothetical protein
MSFNPVMSLYIPHVFRNIDEERIVAVFKILGIGNVRKVDFVLKQDKNGSLYNSVYIHFAQWYDTIAARNLQDRILSSTPANPAKLVYDDPWHWIVLENTAKKHVPGGKKICLDLSPSTGCGPPVRQIADCRGPRSDDFEPMDTLDLHISDFNYHSAELPEELVFEEMDLAAAGHFRTMEMNKMFAKENFYLIERIRELEFENEYLGGGQKEEEEEEPGMATLIEKLKAENEALKVEVEWQKMEIERISDQADAENFMNDEEFRLLQQEYHSVVSKYNDLSNA